MRFISCSVITSALFAALPLHAAELPTQAQIQSAVDAGVAKTASKLPIAVRVTSLLGCQPSPEIKDETVCLVGMSAGMRDGYTTLALRQDNGVWSGVERKQPQYPGPTAAEAQTLMRAWAADSIATDPEAAKDEQMQQAATTLQVKAINDCEVERKTGHLQCDTTLSLDGRPDIKTEFKFALQAGGWRFVPRR